MTRKSRREIESALDDLADETADTRDVRQWVEAYLSAPPTDTDGDADPSADFEVVDADGKVVAPVDNSGEVCVATTDLAEFWVPKDDLPTWLSPERDLPVRV